MDSKTISLTDMQVFDIQVTPEARAYNAPEGSPLNGQFFHIGRYAGKGFTCSPEFYSQWKAGNVARLTLTESEYEQKVDDPLNPGQQTTVTRQSWNFDGFMTNQQVAAFYGSQVGIVEAKTKLEVIQRKALAALKLDDKEVSKLQDAI